MTAPAGAAAAAAASAAAVNAGLTAAASGVGGTTSSGLWLLQQAASLSALNALAAKQVGSDVAALFSTHGGGDPRNPHFVETAHELLPQIIEHNAETAAEVTAQWYDMLDPESKFTATPHVEVPPEQIVRSINWAIYAPGKQTPQARMIGDSQRIVRNASHQTVTRNAHAEGMRWARFAKPTACSYCRALAVRGSGNATHRYLYYSDKSAIYRKSDGDKYHTGCDCEPIAIRGGHVWTPPDYMADWKTEYDDVAKSVPNGPKYFQRITAKMRANEVDAEQGDPDAVQ